MRRYQEIVDTASVGEEVGRRCLFYHAQFNIFQEGAQATMVSLSQCRLDLDDQFVTFLPHTVARQRVFSRPVDHFPGKVES